MLNPADILRLRGAKSYPRVFTGSDPAAAAEASITVPGGVVWEVLAFSITLVTSAVVGHRLPTLVVDDGTTSAARLPSGGVQEDSVTGVHAWVAGGGAPGVFDAATRVGLGGTGSLPAGGLYLDAGWRLRTLTLNLDASDNYAAPSLYVLETTPRIGRRAEPTLEEELLAGVS